MSLRDHRMCSLSAAFPATFVNGISLSKQQRRDRFYRVKFTDIISSMEVKKPAGMMGENYVF